jgi:hypothetical protein
MMRDGVCWERTTSVLHTSAIGSGYWATPKASERIAIKYTQQTSYRHWLEKRQIALSQQVRDRRMWPTPTKTIEPKQSIGAIEMGVAPEAAVGGMLNPAWVEWLMGWPIGWTELQPLEMGRFQQWLNSHGISSKDDAVAAPTTTLTTP